MKEQMTENQTEKQLRRLSRIKLVEIIVEQKKQIDTLESRLSAAEEQLADKEIRIDLQNAESRDAVARFFAQVFDIPTSEEQ